ncbi:hypothetical protein LPB72_00805 [Hydrogenophaga crassostreae]|uniref:Calcineurin-like phosphoesterase domain-containing protein n=1 Tax=Hydrogenophaga crassostreae TaxID=1763535 RepID=A0A162SY68_9BURK|nr:hypothetical protein [Hydrogenophaga crassostreae]AOW13952.1 hypothetical protein LPB072_15010 [Hydrogenophaga crassostreae]OAD44083.1 hypothetical protein LPB72_00805 [Hydrogenophaga crassostreae]
MHQISRALVFCAASACANLAAAHPFSFALWGDMPYAKNKDSESTHAVIQSINRSKVRFSIYDGDIKDGSSQCTDNIYTDAVAMFNSLKQPAVYVPGDNEWTDCHRTNNGGYNGLERLDHLRKVMFSQPRSFGQKTMKLTQQGQPGQKFAENTRFAHDGVMFVNVNMPGSNNNLVTSEKDCAKKSARVAADCEANNVEYLERDAANIAWLRTAFTIARRARHAGLVLVFQADPGFDLPETEETDESQQPRFEGYQAFMKALVQETEQYKGQVLLVHGDTHFFKMDKPLYSPSKVLSNLTRLQTFGSPVNHWVKVSVDVTSPEVFTIRPVMVP